MTNLRICRWSWEGDTLLSWQLLITQVDVFLRLEFFISGKLNNFYVTYIDIDIQGPNSPIKEADLFLFFYHTK